MEIISTNLRPNPLMKDLTLLSALRSLDGRQVEDTIDFLLLLAQRLAEMDRKIESIGLEVIGTTQDKDTICKLIIDKNPVEILLTITPSIYTFGAEKALLIDVGH